MARGRIIDRALFSNEDVGELPVQARHLYIGLIVYADDEGRLKAAPKKLKALIFPYDHSIRVDTVKQWLDMICKRRLAKLYVVNNEEYIMHPNWEDWQYIRADRKQPSKCPAPDCQPNGNQVSTKCQPDDRIKEVKLNKDKEKSGGNSLLSSTTKASYHNDIVKDIKDTTTTASSLRHSKNNGNLTKEVIEIVSAYVAAAGLPMVNEYAKEVFARKNRYQAEGLLKLAGGNMERARLAIEHLVAFYKREGKENWSLDWMIRDYPDWDKERLKHEMREVSGK